MPVISESSPSPKSVKLVQTCHIQLTAYCNTKQFHRCVHNSKVIEILNEQLRPSMFKAVKLRWVWFNIFARHTICHCGQDLACQVPISWMSAKHAASESKTQVEYGKATYGNTVIKFTVQ